jgi:uncharacterized membrane protein
MAYYIKLYCATFAVFFAVDMLWLGLLARGFYKKHLGYLLAPLPNWPAAIAFYLIFIAGILFFVVLPGLKQEAAGMNLLLRAAFFGLVTYATYDLTNQATIKDWPVLVTVVDMIWGMGTVGTENE